MGLPLPPGTSLSWMPPSSLYCTQKSVSKISAAAAKRSKAASPLDRLPLPSCRPLLWAKTDEVSARRAIPAPAAPAANPFLRNERLPDGALESHCELSIVFTILFFCHGISLSVCDSEGLLYGKSRSWDATPGYGNCQKLVTSKRTADTHRSALPWESGSSARRFSGS